MHAPRVSCAATHTPVRRVRWPPAARCCSPRSWPRPLSGCRTFSTRGQTAHPCCCCLRPAVGWLCCVVVVVLALAVVAPQRCGCVFVVPGSVWNSAPRLCMHACGARTCAHELGQDVVLGLCVLERLLKAWAECDVAVAWPWRGGGVPRWCRGQTAPPRQQTPAAAALHHATQARSPHLRAAR
jgi:hypothetical protein